jgi:anti-anti-sigma regulatory factor
MGQHTLRISIQENDNSIGVTLVGRLAGPWVAELDQAWKEVAARLDGKKLSLNVRDLTYSDASGKKVLSDIFKRTRADFVTGSDWSQHLANEIMELTPSFATERG